MNREQLHSRASGRIEKVRLGDGTEVSVRPLSALDRARVFDRYNALKSSNGNEPTLEEIVKTQCFVVSRGLVDESGRLLYQEEDTAAISADLWDSIDELAAKIIELNRKAKEDAEKNLQTTPSAISSSD